MSRRRTTFRQRDLTAAVKGALAAGCTVASVGVSENGTIVVVVRKGDEVTPIGKQESDLNIINEWDSLK